MNDGFEGHHVVVTGGTSGIGAATALAFAQLGATVTALGLAPADPGMLPVHDRVEVVEQDVTDTAAFTGRIAALPRIDHLVHCAGISMDRGEYDLAAFDRVLAVNLRPVLAGSEAARAALAANGGSIVTVASMFAFFGSADRPAYSASKGGVVQVTRSLAAEYAAEGIRVNAVAPGFVATPLARGILDDPAARAAVLARIPLGRFGEPAEVATVITFLCSPAACYVTGAVVPVDGGHLAC